MPSKLERHARGKWAPLPPRSAEVAAAAADDPDPSKRAAGRKDTRSWCKGKAGRAHRPHLVFRPWSARQEACEWGARWIDDAVRWQCRHREECQVCGKILREASDLAAGECPGYPGSAEQRVQAEAEDREVRARVAAHRALRRPAITGPQGYRRKRGD